jgi:hypothetical protein
MALAAPVAITMAGTTHAVATPSATENITWSGALLLYVENTGSIGTVTLVDPGRTPAGSSPTNPTVSIPATTGKKFIYLPVSLINPATQQMQITFAGGTFGGVLYYV